MGKPWTFSEIRPDAIIGFVPQNNAMNLAQALGLFLSLWKETNHQTNGNQGEAPLTVPFPGSQESYTALHTDTSQDILARFHIFVSLHKDPEATVSGRAFNIADGEATTWEREWPEICAWFGLRGGPPLAGGQKQSFSAQAWMEEHQGIWREWVGRHGLKEGALEGTSWKFMQVCSVFHHDVLLCNYR